MRAIAVALMMLVAGSAMAAPGRCLLVVDGRTYLNGPCPVELLPGGSFMVGAGRGASHFAQVTVEGAGSASGYWNEEPGATHAHSSLGSLRRNDACWTNERAIICAWR